MPEVEKVRIVTISTQIKAAASMFFDKPHLASRYYGRLLKSIDGIFNEEHKALLYYICAYLLYKVEYLFRNKMLPAQYRKFRFHILMRIKYDFSEDKIPALNANKMDALCEKILECANDNAQKTCHSLEEAIQVRQQMRKIRDDFIEWYDSLTEEERHKAVQEYDNNQNFFKLL